MIYLLLIGSFPQSYYLYPDDYLVIYQQQRRYNIVNYGQLTSQCFPIILPEYDRDLNYDSIQISYLTGINFKGIYIDEDFSYQADIPIFLRLELDEYYGVMGSGYFHFGHEGGKTDSQKIVGFVPGFEIPLENFYVYFQKDRLKIELGRNRLYWGPGNYSSVFLSENLSYDMLKISYHGEDIHFENLITPLDAETKKYMAAQRFEISMFSGKLLLGLNEAVVWSNRIGEYYLIPISPYYLIQRYYGESEDNVMGGADLQLILDNNYRFYVQGMVDDVGFSPPEPPEKLGFLFGIDIYNLFKCSNLDFTLEISGVSPYTYSHYNYTDSFEVNGFYRNDTCTGHQLGNNFWDSKIQLSWNNNNIYLSSIFGLTIQGSYDLKDPWTWNKEFNPSWPSGLKQRTLYIIPKLEFSYQNLNLSIISQYKMIENYQWIRGNDEDILDLNFNIYYSF